MAHSTATTPNHDTQREALYKAIQVGGRYIPCGPPAETPPRAAQGHCRGLGGAGEMGE